MDYTAHAEWSLFLYLSPQLFIDVPKTRSWLKTVFWAQYRPPARASVTALTGDVSQPPSQRNQKQKNNSHEEVFSFIPPHCSPRPNLVTV